LFPGASKNFVWCHVTLYASVTRLDEKQTDGENKNAVARHCLGSTSRKKNAAKLYMKSSVFHSLDGTQHLSPSWRLEAEAAKNADGSV